MPKPQSDAIDAASSKLRRDGTTGDGTVLTKARERLIQQQRSADWLKQWRELNHLEERASRDLSDHLKVIADSDLPRSNVSLTGAGAHSGPSITLEVQEATISRSADFRSLLVALRRYKQRLMSRADLDAGMKPVEIALQQQLAIYQEAEQEAKELLARHTFLVTQSVSPSQDQGGRSAGGLKLRYDPNGEPISVVAEVRKHTTLPAEVTAFDEFLATNGGARLGWDDYDHQVFLRVLLQGRAKEGRGVLLDVLAQELPTRTFQELEEHVRLYDEFTKLHDAKRVALTEWKNQKAADTENEERVAEIQRRRQEQQLLDVQNRKAQISAELHRQQKQQLLAWKAEKEAAKERQVQELQSMEQQRKKEAAALYAMRLVEKATLSAQLKRQFEACDSGRPRSSSALPREVDGDSDSEELDVARRRPMKVTPHDLQRRQCNDKVLVQRRLALKKSKEEEKNQTKLKMMETYLMQHPGVGVGSSPGSDPGPKGASAPRGKGPDLNRLCQPTASSANRQPRAASASASAPTGQSTLLRGTDYLQPKPLTGVFQSANRTGWAGKNFMR